MSDAACTKPCEPEAAVVSEVFPHLMDVGEAMIMCGADVHAVEQLIIRLGRAYGATRMNVLAITAVIVVTVSLPNGGELTFSRRVEGGGQTDFARLEALNSLCKECLSNPLPASELSSRLQAIKRMREPKWYFYLGGILSAGSFAVFFGGSLLDGAVSALFAILVCAAMRHLRVYMPNVMAFDFAVSLAAGIAIAAVSGVFPAVNVDMVTIGVIMLLIPGVAMTNATRDMLSGDTISGVMRFVESLLWATALALGFMVSLWVARAAGLDFSSGANSAPWQPWQTALAALGGSVGFALFFNVSPRRVAVAALGGLLVWVVFDLVRMPMGSIFVPCVVASTFAAVYSEAVSRVLRVPATVFFIVSVIPLVPGRGLYYTMFNAVNGDLGACGDFAVMTLLYAAGIAVGICLVAAVGQTWEAIKRRRAAGPKGPSDGLSEGVQKPVD